MACEREIRIGTAGWALPAAIRARFPEGDSNLQRYAGRLNATEINSSFYRPHRRATWQRWAESVPDGFRFAAKLPKAISHERRLIDCAEPLTRFAGEVGGLGGKLGVMLVQLPPSLRFDVGVADAFFALLRDAIAADVACEPRHASWFGAEADALLVRHHVARVAADPALAEGGGRPGGWPGLTYYRLHGSPLIYRSPYEADRIVAIAAELRAGTAPAWCIFDNTASGAAAPDALALVDALAPDDPISS